MFKSRFLFSVILLGVFTAYSKIESLECQTIDTLECQTKDGLTIILFPNKTWSYLPNSKETKSISDSSLKWPEKKQYNHPPFSDKISAEYYLRQKYDKFKDITSQEIGIKITSSLTLGFASISEGKSISAPAEVILRIVSHSEDWEFLRNSRLIFIADEEKIDLGDLERDGTVGSGYVLEFLNTMIPAKTFLKIINSKTVQGQLFHIEFHLSEEQLEALRDFASGLY